MIMRVKGESISTLWHAPWCCKLFLRIIEASWRMYSALSDKKKEVTAEIVVVRRQ